MERQTRDNDSEEISEILPIALVKFDKSGKVSYMNRASQELLASVAGSPETLSSILPPQHKALIKLAFREQRIAETDWSHNGRTFHLVFKSSGDRRSVYVFMMDLTAQEEAKAKLVQSEKMASLGLLVAGLAHEINTPLGAIHSNNDTISKSIVRVKELLSGDAYSNERQQEAARLVSIIDGLCRNTSVAAERLMRIVGSLKNFARLDEAELKRADIHEGIDSTLTIVQHQLKNRIEVVKHYGQIPLVECHPNAINQVFMNLLVNAAQAIPGRGVITIKTTQEAEFVRIAISDTGVGIPSENIAKVFDPGFTTKGVGVGTGLGLSICYKIIQEHQGKIEVESDDHGTTFTICLPLRHPKRVKRG